MGTVPAPTVCPRCDGSRTEALIWTGRGWRDVRCGDCCCEVCGDPTDTPPLCERHQREQDDLEAAKAWREGRHE